MNDDTPDSPLLQEARLWQEENWTAQVIKNEDDDGWAPMKRWKTYFTRINSAFVMTVHKSQGSTFRHVYVSDDISRERDRLKKNPLLYVSATRASESITFER